MAGYGTYGGLPAVFFIEQCDQFTDGSARMAPENRCHHVDSGEAAIAARSASVRSSLCPTAATLSRATDPWPCSAGVGYKRLLSSGRRDRYLPSYSKSVSCASLQQFDPPQLVPIPTVQTPASVPPVVCLTLQAGNYGIRFLSRP